MNPTLSGQDFSYTLTASAYSLLGIYNCFLRAMQASPTFSISTTLAFSPRTSVPATSLTGPTAVASRPVSLPPPAPQHRKTKIILGIVIPVVGLASTAIFTWWIWRKRRAAVDKAQNRIASVVGYTKPELDAKQSRHEMDGERERHELAAGRVRHELAASA